MKFVEEKERNNLVKEEKKSDLVCEEKEIIIEKIIGLNFPQDDGKIFDLIDMDFIAIQKNFAPKELTESMKFLDNYPNVDILNYLVMIVLIREQSMILYFWALILVVNMVILVMNGFA